MNENEGVERKAGGLRIFWGRVLCVVGILLAIVGAFFVSVALGALGIVFGVVGYGVGARNFGFATIILAVVSIFVGLFIGQGVIAGSYDEAVNGIKEAIQYPRSNS
jgi:hypothetical protein